jgi:hypothetical protein
MAFDDAFFMTPNDGTWFCRANIDFCLANIGFCLANISFCLENIFST